MFIRLIKASWWCYLCNEWINDTRQLFNYQLLKLLKFSLLERKVVERSSFVSDVQGLGNVEQATAEPHGVRHGGLARTDASGFRFYERLGDRANGSRIGGVREGMFPGGRRQKAGNCAELWRKIQQQEVSLRLMLKVPVINFMFLDSPNSPPQSSSTKTFQFTSTARWQRLLLFLFVLRNSTRCAAWWWQRRITRRKTTATKFTGPTARKSFHRMTKTFKTAFSRIWCEFFLRNFVVHHWNFVSF